MRSGWIVKYILVSCELSVVSENKAKAEAKAKANAKAKAEAKAKAKANAMVAKRRCIEYGI